MATGRERLVFEVLTTAGHTAAVEIRVHPLAVEIWRGIVRHAAFNRKELRIWLSDPQSPIRANDVTLSPDHSTTGHLTITMPDVPRHILPPQVTRALDAQLS